MVKERKRDRNPGYSPTKFSLFRQNKFKLSGVFLQSVSCTKGHLFYYFCYYFEWSVSINCRHFVFRLTNRFDPFIPSNGGYPAYQKNQEIRKISGKLRIMERFSRWPGKYHENLLFQKFDTIFLTPTGSIKFSALKMFIMHELACIFDIHWPQKTLFLRFWLKYIHGPLK